MICAVAICDNTADNKPKWSCALNDFVLSSSLLVAMLVSSGSAYSYLANKDVSEMICHLKVIFVWIFLILQPTGNVFIWDFVLQFFVFNLLSFSYQNSVVADCDAF